ncbi:4-oxalocrotonate tautomerase family protein [Arthrobacter sp. FW306-04-A]|uniref:tautomerase family protein n=1 Tax=Arthrobacter sp. FW306-04-A TaxID=2879619 RepID=UPI0037BE24C4|nr:4-oxalocrotonate tautomerase family protein [Arthrobacter sp. FW306-04-A]
MPLIQVLNASPSSTEKKRQLLAALTATYAEVMEIRPDTIRVILNEIPTRTGLSPASPWRSQDRTNPAEPERRNTRWKSVGPIAGVARSRIRLRAALQPTVLRAARVPCSDMDRSFLATLGSQPYRGGCDLPFGERTVDSPHVRSWGNETSRQGCCDGVGHAAGRCSGSLHL